MTQTATVLQQAITFPEKEWQTATPESQGVDSGKLDEAMEHLKTFCGEHGNSKALVVRNGYVIWQGTDMHNKHLAWSCTKSFLSTCLGLLWDDGKCAPDTLAYKHFPELEKDYPTVTLEHLATFTSGYGCAEEEPLIPLAPFHKPGEAFHYNAQSDLLGAILTRIAGETLKSLFLRRIGTEIGLNDENFDWLNKFTIDGIPVNGGAGYTGSGVHTTAMGLARFGWFYTCGGTWKGRRLISQRYIDYASVPRVAPTVPPHDPKAWYIILPGSYGLNWWVNGIIPSGRRMWPSAPVNTYAAQGNLNHICFVVQDWNMTIVRQGGDVISDTDQYDRMFALIKEGTPDLR